MAAKLKHGLLELAEGDETIAILVERTEKLQRARLSGGALLAHLRNGALARMSLINRPQMGKGHTVSSNAFAHAGVWRRPPSAFTEDSLNWTSKLSSNCAVLTETSPRSSCEAKLSACSGELKSLSTCERHA